MTIKVKEIRGGQTTYLTDVYDNKIEEGDVIVYTPMGRYATPRILKVLRVAVDYGSSLCVCVNGIYYSSYYVSNHSVLLYKHDGTPVLDNLTFNDKGYLV